MLEIDAIASASLHPMLVRFLQSEAQTRVIITGNQAGKTFSAMFDAALRVMGIHPVARRNELGKPIRMVSKSLPGGPSDESNQQYVEFKRLLPLGSIKKDVTARSSLLIANRPLGGEAQVEFMAKTQEIDAFMSVQRSAYYQDEEIDRLKFDECQMRLLRLGGDTVVTLTPVRGMDWTYDLLWRKARRIYRSKTVADKFGLPEVEDTGVDSDIEVFCWATDDNPVMDQLTIDRIFEGIDDPDELAMRRYGVFRQVSGRIYKAFDPSVHVIPAKGFNISKFKGYWHFRVIDYHPGKPWYISWVAVTPHHEWFVWNEMLGNHDLATTHELRDQIKAESLLPEDHIYNRATLIDPLAKVKQQNTGFSVFDDISMGELGLRRCTAADTKNVQGRANIKTRLKNAAQVGVPGNNMVTRDFSERFGMYLPTIWFFEGCKGHIEHFNSWRYVDWKQEHVKAVKTVKRESEKWSDYCRNLEFLGALDPVWYAMPVSDYEPSGLFQGRA